MKRRAANGEEDSSRLNELSYVHRCRLQEVSFPRLEKGHLNFGQLRLKYSIRPQLAASAGPG
jgi:hypothetical protein